MMGAAGGGASEGLKGGTGAANEKEPPEGWERMIVLSFTKAKAINLVLNLCPLVAVLVVPYHALCTYKTTR
jgi:hypothetical protein